ncbi:hypothetical protein, partial [Maridesulfovibrio zosterae]|uniref:hypothetical protein n=1 Tax=Maridesulfovibrio zosterae TaxID=82171 RepID=UPI00054D6206
NHFLKVFPELRPAKPSETSSRHLFKISAQPAAQLNFYSMISTPCVFAQCGLGNYVNPIQKSTIL